MEAWTVLLRDHHEDYITWEQHEQPGAHPAQHVRQACRRHGGRRGGRALISGLLDYATATFDYTTAMFVSLQRASNHSYHSYSSSGLSC